MKSVNAILVAAMVAGFVACGGAVSSQTLPAVSPEAVEVIPQGQKPSDDYETLKRISYNDPGTVTSDVLIARAREEAAALGADALLIKSVRRDPSAHNPRIYLLAEAIYYPSRHPEPGEDRN